jgi:hypothetical protein
MGRRASKRVRPSLNPPGKRGEAAHEPSIEWRLPKTRKCEAPKCGNDFVVSSANGNAKTCSPECSLKFELAWRKQYWIDCKGDPKKHEKIKARLNARYHCNYRPVMRPCIVCGEKFRVSCAVLSHARPNAVGLEGRRSSGNAITPIWNRSANISETGAQKDAPLS